MPNISATHAFNYIVLRIKFGLTSSEELATPLYCILPVNSCSLSSSHPWIMASGCSANAVINTALGYMLQLVSELLPKYIELYGIAGLHKDLPQ